MKNADIFLKFQELNSKYSDEGLTINIEFDRWGMIFRGYWALKGHNELIRLNRIYEYTQIKHLSDEIDIEFLIDEFKNEFEKKLKEAEE